MEHHAQIMPSFAWAYSTFLDLALGKLAPSEPFHVPDNNSMIDLFIFHYILLAHLVMKNAKNFPKTVLLI